MGEPLYFGEDINKLRDIGIRRDLPGFQEVKAAVRSDGGPFAADADGLGKSFGFDSLDFLDIFRRRGFGVKNIIIIPRNMI